jgi:DNA-binding NarL/FixJ family response regulator
VRAQVRKGGKALIAAQRQSDDAPRRETRAAGRIARGERPRTRIVLVDDNRFLRRSVRGLLETEPDMQVVGEAGNGEEALEVIRREQPDVVVMDISMPLMDGIEATRRAVAETPTMRIIGLSLHSGEQIERLMMGAGAVALVAKDGPPEDLLIAIRAARPSGPPELD